MSRPIEFRFWHKANEEMFNDMQALDGQDINDIFLDEDFVFMQYTGLTDKNGKKVFEGDVLESPDFVEGSLSIVLFNCRGQFVAADPECYEDFCLLDDYDFFVCGNIYETPELLNANSNT